jgi:3-hydroxyisobutyrate dehydrogenase-like beta-hydroxyacid dehydrogenase
VQLLETAQVIWARAHHERLDAHISPYILAAATQWIVERRHFAVPSTVEAITKDFGIAEEQLRATARQLVMQFQIEVVSHRLLLHGLGAQDGAHLARTFQAIMTGGTVDDFGSGRHLL